MLKVDIYPHILPKKYMEALVQKAPRDFYGAAWLEVVPTLFDLDLRFEIMEKWGEYIQVINLASPPIEAVVGAKDAIELAKLANDEMAELVQRYPHRFVGAVGCLPMSDVDAALEEVDRVIQDLNFRGVQVFTNVLGKALDNQEFWPLFEKMEGYQLPILIHPHRAAWTPEYVTEDTSKYSLWDKFGWPFDTTVTMTRLVMSGVLERYPRLKVVTHHAGGMVPFFGNRIEDDFDLNERQGLGYKVLLRKPVLDYFRQFFADTALYGCTAGLMCARAFFGADHMLFATDMPYDSQLGHRFVRETIRSVDEMDISDDERALIYWGNAKKLMRLPI